MMSEYRLFQPGEYQDFEKDEVQLRWDIYHGKRAMPGPPGMPPMDPDDEASRELGTAPRNAPFPTTGSKCERMRYYDSSDLK